MFQDRKIDKQAFLRTIVSLILAGALASLSYFCKSCPYTPVCYGTTIAYGIIIGLTFLTFLDYASKRHYMAACIFGAWVFFAIWFCLFYLPDAYFDGVTDAWVLVGLFPLLASFVVIIIVLAYCIASSTPACIERIIGHWCPKRRYSVFHNGDASSEEDFFINGGNPF